MKKSTKKEKAEPMPYRRVVGAVIPLHRILECEENGGPRTRYVLKLGDLADEALRAYRDRLPDGEASS